MMDHRAIRRYSESLFGLAVHRRELEPVQENFLLLRELVVRHREISHLVSNSTISLTEKEDFIEKIVPSGIPALLLNFLKVLIKKKRFNELGAIQEEFHRLYEKSQGIKEVEAISVLPLSSVAENRLREALTRKLNSKVRLLTKTDPALIGGLILRFDGMEINSSYKSKLEEIRQKLLSTVSIKDDAHAQT